MPFLLEPTVAHDTEVLSIALIGPDESRRNLILAALEGCSNVRTHEFVSYPATLAELPRMLDQDHDVVMVDLDANTKLALEIVGSICGDSSRTVMVFSAQTDHNLVVESMRAGAREFLFLPLSCNELTGALERVSTRRPGVRPKSAVGSFFVFMGTKGGCGVTTLASNFAVSLARESHEKVLLIDLGLPLGDAAIHLGIAAEYSTENAFRDIGRLDTNLLFTLLNRHSSGVYVLSAPAEFPVTAVNPEQIEKLLAVARQSFDYVVIDAGSRIDLMNSDLFDVMGTLYLVTQIGVSELRNANRLISQFFSTRGRKLQIVVNRYVPQNMLLDEEHVHKALTRAPQWKIPNDSVSARRTRNTSTVLMQEDSPICDEIRKMARKACGLSEEDPPAKKSILSFFGKKS
jgi:pilus assembly protein CpaE